MSPTANGWPEKGESAFAKHQPAITAILDKLDAADDSKYRNRRGTARCPYRRIDVPIRIHHPGGTVALKTVATRNLSTNGIGFLYTGFLHTGTLIEIKLARRAGGEDVLKGRVVFCSHIAGSFHQIGIRIDTKIVIKAYVDRESMEKMEGAGLAPTTLGGKVLHVDDSEVDRKLMAHYLKTTKVSLTSVSTPEEAVVAVKAQTFDLILCDINLKSTTGDVVIRQLREAGYAGRIMVVSIEKSPERIRAMKLAGATGMLAKPYDQTKLLALIGAFLKREVADTGITSTLASQVEMKPLIEKYVQSVQQIAIDLESAQKADAIDKIRTICTSLKSSGTGYGFAMISEAAKDAMKMLDATMSLQESENQVKQLLDLCKRVIVR